MDRESDDHRGGLAFRLALLAVGVVQGFGLFMLADAPWQGNQAWLMAGTAFCVLAPPTFQLLHGSGPLRRTVLASLAFGGTMALLALWSDWRVTGGGAVPFEEHRALFFGSLPVIAYIVWPYLQTWTARVDRRFPYADLFRYAWSNILVAAVAAAFLGVFWLVLFLLGALFNLVGVDFFEELFTEALFAWTFSGGVFGLGIAIARENERLVPVLRRVALMLFQVLAPVLAGAALLFLAFIPFTGLAPLWATVSATAILVCLMFAVTLVTNAVVQDGDRPLPFGRWMGWLMAATLLSLPAFAAIAFYAIRLRIDQYGPTPERFVAQIIVAVAALHVLAYAVGVILKRRDWASFVTRVNPWIAPLVVLLAALLHTPVADPYTHSANAQVERLAAGKVDAATFDYAYLRFMLGQPGRDALEKVAAISGHPQQAAIKAGLTRAMAADSYWSAEPPVPRSRPMPIDLAALRRNVTVRPEGATVSDEVLQALNKARGWEVRRCLGEDRHCGLLATDLNRDGMPEYVFITVPKTVSIGEGASDGADLVEPAVSGMLLYGSGTAWSARDANLSSSEAVWQSFLAGDIELVAPKYYDIRIGGSRLHY
jgi:hypothetical protein